MFKNQLLGDFTDVKYEDIKIEMKSVLNTFSIEKYLQSFCHTLVFIGQIYFFSKAEDFLSKFFLYIISLITLRLLFSATNYFQLVISQEISTLFCIKNYYEIGNLFKKAILVAECLNVILYFPFKFLFQFLLNILILNKAPLSTILTIPIDICKEKLRTFLYLNFYSLLMYSVNSILSDIIFTFQMKSIININSIIRVVVNITVCHYFNKKSPDNYFMNGIAYANILTDAFSLIFLMFLQHIKNPYPQAWVQFNLQIFSFSSFRSIFSLFDYANFLSYIILHSWDDFFILIYSCISLTQESIQTLLILFSLMLFKHLFFYIKRKDKEEIIEYYQQLEGNSSTSMFNKLSYEYDSPNQGTKGNFQWMMFIKTKLMGTIVINFIIGIIYVLFYLFGGFKVLKQEILGWWYIIPFYAFNAIAEQCSYQMKGIREYLLKKNSLIFILIAFAISLMGFVLFKIFFGDYFIMLILGLHAGYYFLLYKFYPEIKNVDMRIVNLEMLMHCNNEIDTPYMI